MIFVTFYASFIFGNNMETLWWRREMKKKGRNEKEKYHKHKIDKFSSAQIYEIMEKYASNNTLRIIVLA